jgi:hypothetical protein
VPTVEKRAFFQALGELGMLPEKSARDSGKPLVYSGRQIVAAALRSMHDMAIVNEWDAPHFCGYASAPWWQVPGESGIVAAGLFWDVLLIDYAAVTSNDLSVLDNRGWDGDYNMRTIGHLETMYLVRDTDEFNAISWNSLPGPPLVRRPLGVLGKATTFRSSYWGDAFNDFHRQLIVLPTRIHAAPINEKWSAVEARALRTLLTWLDPPTDFERLYRKLPPELRTYEDLREKIASSHLPWWRRTQVVWSFCRLCLFPGIGLVLALKPTSLQARIGRWVPISRASIRSGMRRIFLALLGDREALSWWIWYGRRVGSRVRRKPFPEPSGQARK